MLCRNSSRSERILRNNNVPATTNTAATATSVTVSRFLLPEGVLLSVPSSAMGYYLMFV